MPPFLKPYPGPRPPQVDKIWVIVPFSRPENLPRILQNFSRQHFQGKKLILIGNGRAAHQTLQVLQASAEARLNLDSVVWGRSSEHQSHAKNEALAFIKRHGGGFFTTMDDDDWYGPGYLDELAGYAKTYDALGKQWHFVSLGEGLSDPTPQLLFCNRLHVDQDNAWLTGGTISGWAETALPFPVTPGEDLGWCEKMKAQGAKIRGLSAYHYLYRRSYAGAAHTWSATRKAFVKSIQGYGPWEFPLTAEGEIDLAIVIGDKQPTEYRVLGQPRFIPAP